MRFFFLVILFTVFAIVIQQNHESMVSQGKQRSRVLATPPKKVLIGVSWPFAKAKDGFANGLNLALEEINTQNLLGNTKLSLIMKDDEDEWRVARKIALDFAARPNMLAVIGYRNDDIAIMASTLYEKAKLLHIIAGATSISMTKHSYNYLIRTIPSSEKLIHSLSAQSSNRGGKYAVIWGTDSHSEELAENYKIAQNSEDATLAYEISFSHLNPDFRLIVNELKRARPNTIFVAGRGFEIGLFLKEAHRVNLTSSILFVTRGLTELREHTREVLEGSIYLDFYDPNNPLPENIEFVGKYMKKFNKLPDSWAAQGYDSLHILAEAIKEGKTMNPLTLSYDIRFDHPWKGVNGLYSFDGDGELQNRKMYLKTIHHGKEVTLSYEK
jgi:branched-chain amino acid transport system substrate-binding protein